MSSTARQLKDAMQKYAQPGGAEHAQRFFKTGEGQYGAGDIFIGVRVPATRAICKIFKDLPLPEIKKLLASPIHEHRLAAVILLANQYVKADEADKQAIYDLYLQASYDGRINNWDIVDISAEFIIGPHLENRSRDLLFELAKSTDVWQRRVAMISTFYFIKHGDPTTSLALAEELLHDRHDLIQKAVGWMLREIGKRVDRKVLLAFLDKHARAMPRTMLRYSLEHLTPEQKIHYMNR
jgi:3-methyladenine DNA glycosylase AlkD